MSGYSDPPITFGSSGGIVWPLRAAPRGGGVGGGGGGGGGGDGGMGGRRFGVGIGAGGGGLGHEDPAASLLATTRRPRLAPSHAALRLYAAEIPETIATCGRRWDPREWGERGHRSNGSGSGSNGNGTGGDGGEADDDAHAQDLAAFASYSFMQDQRRERRRDRRRARRGGVAARNDDDDDDEEEEEEDEDDDDDEYRQNQNDDEREEDAAAEEEEEEAAAFARDPEAPQNPRLDREEAEARVALMHGHLPIGIPRRVLREPLLRAHVDVAAHAMRRVGRPFPFPLPFPLPFVCTPHRLTKAAAAALRS